MHLRHAPLSIAFSVLLLTGCSEAPKSTVPYKTLIERLSSPEQICGLDTPGAKIVTSYDRSGGNND